MKILKIKVIILLAAVVFITGCAPMLRYLVHKEQFLQMPVVVAYLEPILKENKVVIMGKLVLENPQYTDLNLDKINLTIKDNQGAEILKSKLEWNKGLDEKGNKHIEAPVQLALGLNVLTKEALQIFVKTTFFHKKLNVRVPIESKVAVLKLSALKSSFKGSLIITIHSTINSDILGNLAVEYSADIMNPFEADLMLEDGEIKIYVKENRSIATSHIKSTLLKAKQLTKISGNFKLQDTIGQIVIREFIKTYSIKTELIANLRLAGTQIIIPFKIDSIQQIDFSLFTKREDKVRKNLIEKIKGFFTNKGINF